jgi:hypothetical protein
VNEALALAAAEKHDRILREAARPGAPHPSIAA